MLEYSCQRVESQKCWNLNVVEIVEKNCEIVLEERSAPTAKVLFERVQEAEVPL